MSEGGQKKRSKGWYRKQAYHNKRMKTDGKPGHRLSAGLKGFIVTCNERERDAVKESYNILNEYADKLYGPETRGEAENGGESDGEDIEAAIAREIQDLKDTTAMGERRFQNTQTGAKNCIFIKTTLDDPVALAHAIFTDLHQNKVQKSRHALRLLPVVGTCKAGVAEINALAKTVLPPFFTETKLEVTFTVTFKARNNHGIGREMVISTLRKTIVDICPSVLLRFTHVNPQLTVLVEVMCGVACIAVAKDFARFRKYNLVEVGHDKPDPAHSTHGIQSDGAEVMQRLDSDSVDKTKNHAAPKSEDQNSTSALTAAEMRDTVSDTDPPSVQDSVSSATSARRNSEAGNSDRTYDGMSGCGDDSVTGVPCGEPSPVCGQPSPNDLLASKSDSASLSVTPDHVTPAPQHGEGEALRSCDELLAGSRQSGQGSQDVLPQSDETDRGPPDQ